MGRSAKGGLKAKGPLPGQTALFPPVSMPATSPGEPELRPLERPIWTEHKARLIERYLYYFVLVTHHGTYIDGFAGPQAEPEMWAAKLVLESEPRWLRNFYLFDVATKKVKALKVLRAAQPARRKKEPARTIEVYKGDFNERVRKLLASGRIPAKEATFCLLDQHTFECRWSTVKALAGHKASGRKIELFYFLASGWLDRALEAQKDKRVLATWWGRDDWTLLRPMKLDARARAFEERFRKELGYASAKAYPIRSREGGGRIMYHMIHATDHADAPALMYRAYHRAVEPKEPQEQLLLELAPLTRGGGAA